MNQLDVGPPTLAGYAKSMACFVKVVQSELPQNLHCHDRVTRFATLRSYLEQDASRAVKRYRKFASFRRKLNLGQVRQFSYSEACRRARAGADDMNSIKDRVKKGIFLKKDFNAALRLGLWMDIVQGECYEVLLGFRLVKEN